MLPAYILTISMSLKQASCRDLRLKIAPTHFTDLRLGFVKEQSADVGSQINQRIGIRNPVLKVMSARISICPRQSLRGMHVESRIEGDPSTHQITHPVVRKSLIEVKWRHVSEIWEVGFSAVRQRTCEKSTCSVDDCEIGSHGELRVVRSRFLPIVSIIS